MQDNYQVDGGSKKILFETSRLVAVRLAKGIVWSTSTVVVLPGMARKGERDMRRKLDQEAITKVSNPSQTVLDMYSG